MHSIIRYRFSAIIFFVIVLCIFLFTKCIDNGKNNSKAIVNNNYNNYAGSAKCISCHKSIYDSHIRTAHFLTSTEASENTIKGSFDSGKNIFTYSNGSFIAMEKKSDGYYQTAIINGIEKISQRFDIVIGSGTRGQSYATWLHNELLQLPITYFTSANQWSNSPGYPNKIALNRMITSRCLECHSTYAAKVSDENKMPEFFNKNQMILGVDCEKCHGPAEKHVEYQTQNPKETKAKFIMNPASFTRQQSLDLCALCHGGRLKKSTASFQFTSGNKLSDYFDIDTTAKDANNIDVHGNQYGLLAASKCFKMSNILTCVTCHNSHENQKGKTELFSQKCISCHNTEHGNGKLCKLGNLATNLLNKNCTSCHMPEQPSMAIGVILQGNNIPTSATMHTHYIKVYPNETKNVLDYFKKNK